MVRRLIETLRSARVEGWSPYDIVTRLWLAREDDTAQRPLSRSDTPKLSVIVIGHNMPRELPRTIRSLSPTMQRDIEPGDYEVILIDNGSTQTCEENELRRLLPGLVMHRMQTPRCHPRRQSILGSLWRAAIWSGCASTVPVWPRPDFCLRR